MYAFVNDMQDIPSNMYKFALRRSLVSSDFPAIFQDVFHTLANMSITHLPRENQYRQISNISGTKSQNWNVFRLVLLFFCPVYWSQVLSREGRCS